MTMKILTTIFLLMLAGSVFAQVPDLNTMTQEEFEAFILEIQGQQVPQVPQLPQQTTVTIQVDEELKAKLDILTGEVGEMKEQMKRMQEKFNVLAGETKTTVEENSDRVIMEVGINNEATITLLLNQLADYIAYATNPIRMNLPAIGAFMMLTSAFLIYISRTYDFKGAKK